MPRAIRFSLFLLAALIVALVVPMSGAAAPLPVPVQAEEEHEEYPIFSFLVDEAGNWKLLEQAEPDVASLSFDEANTILSMHAPGLTALRMDPSIVAKLQQNGVKTITVEKRDWLYIVRANNRVVAEFELGKEALSTIGKSEPAVKLYGLLARLFPRFGLVLKLPGGTNEVPDFSSRLAPPTQTVVANRIELGATISPYGSVLSAGGMKAGELSSLLSSLELPQLPIDLRESGIGRVDVRLRGTSLVVNTDGSQWLRLGVDPQAVADFAPLIADLLAREFGGNEQAWTSLTLAFLAETDLNLTVFVGDAPQEEMPMVQLSPLEVILSPESSDDFGKQYGVYLAYGKYLVDTGAWLANPAMGDILTSLGGSVSLGWIGENQALVASVAGKQLPYLSLEPGLVETATTSLVGPGPWRAMEQALANLRLGVSISVSGSQPSNPLAFTPVEREKPVAVFYQKLAVDSTGNPALVIADHFERLTGILQLAGIDAPSQLYPWLLGYANVDEMGASLLPGGIDLFLNGKSASLVWTDEMLNNLAAVAGPLAEKQLGIPQLVPSLVAAMLCANKSQVSIEVVRSKEEIGPGVSEWVLGQIGLGR